MDSGAVHRPYSAERQGTVLARAPVGTYTRLRHSERGIVMSDIPHEMLDHREPVSHARGHCLINGLGLGMVLAAVLKQPDVTDVTVIEVDRDVIDLVGSS